MVNGRSSFLLQPLYEIYGFKHSKCVLKLNSNYWIHQNVFAIFKNVDPHAYKVTIHFTNINADFHNYTAEDPYFNHVEHQYFLLIILQVFV